MRNLHRRTPLGHDTELALDPAEVANHAMSLRPQFDLTRALHENHKQPLQVRTFY